MTEARPLLAARNRLIEGPPSANTFETMSCVASTCEFFFAASNACQRSFWMIPLARRGEPFRIAWASLTFFFRIRSITYRTLRGDILTNCTHALAIILAPLSQLGGLFGDLAMFPEGPRQGELPQLMAHHVFRNKCRDKRPTVMDHHRQPHEIGRHRRPTRPGLDGLALPLFLHCKHLFHKLLVHKRTLTDRPA